MFSADAKAKIEKELINAVQARNQGFEGKARVCARRACGIALREFFQIKKITYNDPGAYGLLQLLREIHPNEQIQHWTQNLLSRVDEKYNLPVEIDLLVDAQHLIAYLEQDLEDQQNE